MPKLIARVRQDKTGHWEAQVQIVPEDGRTWWYSLGLAGSHQGAWAMVDTYRRNQHSYGKWEVREFELEPAHD